MRLPYAAQVAEECDVAVVCLGLSSILEGEEGDSAGAAGFRGGDREMLNLPGDQQRLLEAVAASGTQVVLVLMSGGALDVAWAQDSPKVPSILQAWYPGQRGGTAVGDVLFGAYCPAGRLPVTFYRTLDDLPPFEDYSMEGRTYRFFKGEPLYPFGYGLSYSRFEYFELEAPSEPVPMGENVHVNVEVTNSGGMDADEVVQVYITDLEASDRVPVRSLMGVERIFLKQGETKTVYFRLSPRDLSMVRADGTRVLEPGEFEVSIGGKQPGFTGHRDAVTTAALTGRFQITGEEMVIEK